MVLAQRKYKYDETQQESSYNRKKKNKKLSSSKKKSIKSSEKIQIILSLIVIGLLCIGILFGYAELTKVKYDINYLNKEISRLEAHIENLRVEVEKIKRSDKIEQQAKEMLGMQYPRKEQKVFLNINQSEIINKQNLEKQKELQDKTDTNKLIKIAKHTIQKFSMLLD